MPCASLLCISAILDREPAVIMVLASFFEKSGVERLAVTQ